MDYVNKNLRLDGVRMPQEIQFEGSGETMVWNNKIVTGFGIRNDPEVPRFLENYFKKEVIGLQLVD